MNRKKLFSDYIFNMIRLALNIGLPIITLPYVLNRIGPENYGVFSYVNSIISYFCMFAVLGIPEYAAREIARKKSHPDIDKTVSEVYAVQFISVSLVLFSFWFIFYSLFSSEYRTVFKILSLLIVTNYFNVEWFYVGHQRFRFMSSRSIVFKILNVAALLLSIKEGDNYYKYALITALTSLGNGLVNFAGVLPHLKFRKLNIRRHLKPIFVLFSLSVTGMINANIDKTLTGMLVGPLYVGYYALGFRLSHLIQQLFTALNSILYPRIMSYLARKDEKQTRKLIGFNMDYILMFSCPIVLGMVLYGGDIISLLFEPEMLPAVPSLLILTFTVPVQAVRRLIRQQILLPRDKERVILILVVMAALSNVLFTCLLVPRYQHVGAAIATLLVEVIGLLVALVYIRKKFTLNIFTPDHMKYILATPILLLPYYLWGRHMLSVSGLLGVISISAIIYFIVLILLKDNLLYRMINKYGKKRFLNRK